MKQVDEGMQLPGTGGTATRTATETETESLFGPLYDRSIEHLLDVPVTAQWVETRAGRTHVLTTGDPTAPPVVVLQGGNVTTPVTLAWLQGLADDYHLIAPDTPGEPGKSHPERPSEYGPWVTDVLDGLGLDRATLVGVSHGGGVLLEAAAHAPDRITAAVLVAPAGFGTPPSLPLARIVVLSLAYRLVPRLGLLERALAPMFTEPMAAVDPVVVDTVATALREGDLDAGFPGPDDLTTLAAFDAPTLLVTAERDPFFPGERTRDRGARSLPGLVEAVVLPDERHFLSPDGQAAVTERVRTFLATQYASDAA